MKLLFQVILYVLYYAPKPHKYEHLVLGAYVHCNNCVNPQECFQLTEICSLSAVLSTVNPVYAKCNMGVTWEKKPTLTSSPLFLPTMHVHSKLNKVFHELCYGLWFIYNL